MGSKIKISIFSLFLCLKPIIAATRNLFYLNKSYQMYLFFAIFYFDGEFGEIVKRYLKCDFNLGCCILKLGMDPIYRCLQEKSKILKAIEFFISLLIFYKKRLLQVKNLQFFQNILKWDSNSCLWKGQDLFLGQFNFQKSLACWVGRVIVKCKSKKQRN